MKPEPASTTVILSGGPGPRVLGMRTSDRNTRVAERVGAVVAEAPPAEGAALHVPSDTLIDATLWQTLPAPNQLHRLIPSGATEGPTVIWGPASDVAASIANGAADSEEHVTTPMPLGSLYDCSAPAARRKTARELLQRTVKPTDGLVSRHLNRPISRVFSHVFLHLRMRPGHASIISLVVGLVTAWVLTRPTWMGMAVGGALFHFASVFDGVDGEMARVSLLDSELGSKIDTAVDNFTYLICIVGFGIGWYREGFEQSDALLLGVMVVMLIFTMLRVARFVRRFAPDGSFVFLDTSVRKAAQTTGLPTLRTVAILFHAMRRDVFALMFMLIGLLGSRQAIVWMLLVGIAVSNFVMQVHRRPLENAARELVA